MLVCYRGPGGLAYRGGRHRGWEPSRQAVRREGHPGPTRNQSPFLVVTAILPHMSAGSAATTPISPSARGGSRDHVLTKGASNAMSRLGGHCLPSTLLLPIPAGALPWCWRLSLRPVGKDLTLGGDRAGRRPRGPGRLHELMARSRRASPAAHGERRDRPPVA